MKLANKAPSPFVEGEGAVGACLARGTADGMSVTVSPLIDRCRHPLRARSAGPDVRMFEQLIAERIPVIPHVVPLDAEGGIAG
jgi:hypothetical protein